MAIVTGIAAGDVRWVFAGCNRAIVTTRAAAQDLRVIDADHGRKEVRRVAILTNVRRLHMVGDFADCINAIVATDAVVDDVGVIEKRRQPAVRLVTVITLLCGGNVIH